MRNRAKELKAEARANKDKAEGESAVLAAIAAMKEPDRAMAKRLHAIIKASAPALSPKTWYGMPAYAKDGNVVCFFQSAQKFKTRYATFGFSDKANLDEGALWPDPSMQFFAWNHGDIQDEIASTWVGYVGPGVEAIGKDGTTWSDHTDVRPTILDLVGLKDDYIHDGRVISEILQGYARPSAVKKSSSFVALAQMYKQLNAPFGEFAMATLRASTKALASNDAGDATYTSIEGQIQSLTTQRDALASQIAQHYAQAGLEAPAAVARVASGRFGTKSALIVTMSISG